MGYLMMKSPACDVAATAVKKGSIAVNLKAVRVGPLNVPVGVRDVVRVRVNVIVRDGVNVLTGVMDGCAVAGLGMPLS